MKAQCPHCQCIQEIASLNVGQKIKCSGCGNDFDAVNQNLFLCPDCFELISKRAAACPKCGAQLKEVVAAPASADHSPRKGAVDISQEKELASYHPCAANFFWGIVIGIITLPILIGVIILLGILEVMYCSRYKVTTHRIIVTTGLLSKSKKEIWIRDMRGANLEQGLWQRIVGVGDISIGTAATAGTEIRMFGVKKPEEAVELINSLREF